MQKLKYIPLLASVLLLSACSHKAILPVTAAPLKNGKFQCGQRNETKDCISREEIERLKILNKVEIYYAKKQQAI